MSLSFSLPECLLASRLKVNLFVFLLSLTSIRFLADSHLFAHDSSHHHDEADLEALKQEYSELVLSFAKMFQANGVIPSLGNVVHGSSSEHIVLPAVYSLHFEQQKIISRYKSNHEHTCAHGCSHSANDLKISWLQSFRHSFQTRSKILFDIFRNPIKFFRESLQSFESWRKQDPHAHRIDPRHLESSLGIYVAKKLKEKLVSSYQHMELQSVQVVYSYDRSIASYIVVSQAIWEAIETVISNMILPGSNIHVACTIFNGALLATAFPMDCVQKLSSNYTFKEAIWKRLIKAFHIYAESHVLKRYASRNYHLKIGEDSLISPPKNLMFANKKQPMIQLDFEAFVSPTTSKSAKLLFVNNLSSLMGVLIKQSGSFLDPLEHERMLDHSELRSLHALAGRLKYIQMSFQTHLEYLAYSSAENLHTLDPDVYLKWLLEFSEFFALEFKLLKDLIDQRSSLDFQDRFNKLWSATDSLLQGLQRLRSSSKEAKDSQCSSVMID